MSLSLHILTDFRGNTIIRLSNKHTQEELLVSSVSSKQVSNESRY
jgi:hypothetical protein